MICQMDRMITSVMAVNRGRPGRAVHPVRGDVALAQPAAFTVVTGVRPWPSSSIRMWSGLARRSSNGDREVPELRAAAAPVGRALVLALPF